MCLGTEDWNAERGEGESEVPKGTVTEPLFVTPPTLKKKDNQLISNQKTKRFILEQSIN